MAEKDGNLVAGGWNWSRIFWVVAAVMVFSYLMRLYSPASSIEQISYTDFKEAVRNERVAEVVFTGNRIQGSYVGPSDEASASAPGSEGGSQPETAASGEPERFSTIKPPTEDPDLLTLLEDNDVTIRAEAESNNWIRLLIVGVLPWVLIVGLMVYSGRKMQQRMGTGAGRLFGFGQSKAKRVAREDVTIDFKDVAGLENTKKELHEIVLYLLHPDRFQEIGAELPKGILLIGPPGVGKTLMARATAGEANVSFYSISGSEFIEMFVGVGASRVRDLFKQAKQNAPSIIFVDELDSIGRVRGSGVGGGNDEREQTLNQILSEMDGFSPRENVIVLAATNRPDVLDPALTRPGRFDRQIALELPRKNARLEILKTHTRNVPLGSNVDLEGLAERAVGMSGADLKNLVNEAALIAARHERDHATPEDFESARDKILMGIERDEASSGKERSVVAYHEAGHALTGKLLRKADPLQKVSIIPRGQALGATEQVPIEDRQNLSRSYLLDRIAVLLGGRAAEKLAFDDLSTGAGHDLKQATQLARRMVCEWGMSETLGPMTFGESRADPFLGRRLSESKEFSEDTARRIDDQVQQLLKAQEKRTDRLLKENQEKLDALAEALLDHEVVTNDEVERILEGKEIETA